MVVVDIQLETGNGLDLVERITAHDKSIGILVWSMYPDAICAPRARCAPAPGVHQQAARTTGWLRPFAAFATARTCEETAAQLLGNAVGRGKHLKASGVESLSDRELEVFRLIGQGLTTSQIARGLHRSIHTVESHRRKIKDKLTLKTAGELNRAAVQWMLDNG